MLPDDDIDLNNLPEDELEVYFNKLIPPAMQRGRVEGQEIPVAVRLPFPSKPILCLLLDVLILIRIYKPHYVDK